MPAPAELITYLGGMVLQVEGHTNNVGSDDPNPRLSGSVTNSVRQYLSQSGVDTRRVTTLDLEVNIVLWAVTTRPRADKKIEGFS